MRTLIPAGLLLTALLSACGGDGTTPPPTTVTPPPTTSPAPEPMFIPLAGAAVGSGGGTTLVTVYVSPTAQEVEAMRLVNEVRTKGTLNGQDALTGSCVDGTFKPDTLKPLTFNGLYAFAARKHAVYMSEVEYEFHDETQTNSPYFYGATVRDRVVRAYKEQADLSKNYPVDHAMNYGGENVVTGQTRNTPEAAMRAWMGSKGHCESIMNPQQVMMGVGYHNATYNSQANRWGSSWALIMGWIVN